MYLVDDDHLARKAQMPQHQVLALKRGHQQLIDRADDEIREQRLLAPLEPAVDDQAALLVVRNVRRPAEQLLIRGVQRGRAVRQPDAVCFVPRLLLRPVHHAGKQAVRRRLRRQTEEQAAAARAAREHLGQRQARFRLSRSHSGLQNENARRGAVRSFQRGALDLVRRKAELFLKCVRIHPGQVRVPRLRQIQRSPRRVHARGVPRRVTALVHRDERKIHRVAGDPVRHDEQTGQLHLRRHGQHRQFLRRGKAAQPERRVQIFPPAAFPCVRLRTTEAPFAFFQRDLRAAVLRLAVMRTDDRRERLRETVSEQYRLARPCVRHGMSLIESPVVGHAERTQRVFVQLRLNVRLELGGQLADVVRERQQTAYRVQHILADLRREPPYDRPCQPFMI